MILPHVKLYPFLNHIIDFHICTWAREKCKYDWLMTFISIPPRLIIFMILKWIRYTYLISSMSLRTISLILLLPIPTWIDDRSCTASVKTTINPGQVLKNLVHEGYNIFGQCKCLSTLSIFKNCYKSCRIFEKLFEWRREVFLGRVSVSEY